MNEPKKRRRPLLGLPAAGLLLATLVGTGVSMAAQSDSVDGRNAGAIPTLLPAGRTYTVTLLTGDVVTVRGTSSGCPTVRVEPAEPSGVLTRGCGPDGHVRVTPAKVASLVGTVLDRDLFDVTAMILDGYDDARTADLPLIVQPGGQNRAPRADSLVADLAEIRALPSIEAVAGVHAKVTGAEFIQAVSARSATTARSAAPKVWLDRRVRATIAPKGRLDANLRQVAAPRAWAAGYTGKGTTVAVLDSGVDATHPDLAGRVVETADFTVDGGDASDHFGHGTHVAAMIAGSGAASGGARKGVAPDARLAVGKVLGDDGEGADSTVIAGMEWAASRADVVNMSLGGFDPSDGTDPLSLAVDRLTEQTGALFVVAAGNSGSLDGTVSSPGAAASALTVGAVDGNDVVPDFSSRGPVVHTHAAKPELVAPGVDIVAARASGTTLGRAIDEHYVAASGTSMSTPHVAGAAAVLAERHPDWQADQFKAALVGAVDPIAGGDPYTSGAGRLNVARALSGVVSAQPVVNLGASGTETKLSWTNTGAHQATVTLRATVTDHGGDTAPATAVSLSDSRLRLAAGTGGGVTLTVDRTVLTRPGFYTAVVTARGGGGVVARTPVTFYVEPPSHDLTVTTTAIPGAPADASSGVSVWVVNIDDPAMYFFGDSAEPGATLTFRVPAGRYSVMGNFSSWTTTDQRAAMAGDPDVAVTGDTSVALDLTNAKPVTASVDEAATEATSTGLTYVQKPRRGDGWADSAFAWGADAKAGHVFVAPNEGTDIGTFQAYAAFGLTAPGSAYDLIHPYDKGIPADPTYRVTAADKARLARIDQHFARLDTPDSATSHKRYGLGPDGVFLAENTTGPLTGDRTDYLSPGFDWIDEAIWNDTVTQEGISRYAPGSRHDKVWVRQPLRSDWYDNPAGAVSECQPAAPARTSGNLHVELVTLIDKHQRFDCLADGYGLDMSRTLTLDRDGQRVGEVDGSIADFTIPKQAADYRLTYDVDVSASLPVSTRVTTSWTFRSSGPNDTGSAPLPLLSVDYALPLDAANHPTHGAATFTVNQAHGVPAQDITSFGLAVSIDDGTTWTTVPVDRAGDGTYRADLPQPAAGEAISLRVTATGERGSGIEQTIIRAYRAG